MKIYFDKIDITKIKEDKINNLLLNYNNFTLHTINELISLKEGTIYVTEKIAYQIKTLSSKIEKIDYNGMDVYIDKSSYILTEIYSNLSNYGIILLINVLSIHIVENLYLIIKYQNNYDLMDLYFLVNNDSIDNFNGIHNDCVNDNIIFNITNEPIKYNLDKILDIIL